MANICFLKKLFNVISHQENANKIYYSQKYLFWIVSSKKNQNRQQKQGMRWMLSRVWGKDGLNHCWCECKLVQWVWPTTETLVHPGSCCFYSQQSGNGTSLDIRQLTSASWIMPSCQNWIHRTKPTNGKYCIQWGHLGCWFKWEISS